MIFHDRKALCEYEEEDVSWAQKVRGYIVWRITCLFFGRSTAEIREENLWLTRKVAQLTRACEESYRDGTARILECRSAIKALEKTVGILEEIEKQQKAEIWRLTGLVDYDPLTGLLNRSGVTGHLARMASALWHAATPVRKEVHEKSLICSIVYIDLDNFKQVNDMFGHGEGDSVLRGVAHLIRMTFSRQADLVARVGGDEFIVIMTHADMEGAAKQAEHLRETMSKDFRFLIGGETGVRVSASIGVAPMTLRPEAGGLSSEMLMLTLNRAIEHADKAMYEAKRSGKDSVSIHPD